MFRALDKQVMSVLKSERGPGAETFQDPTIGAEPPGTGHPLRTRLGAGHDVAQRGLGFRV